MCITIRYLREYLQLYNIYLRHTFYGIPICYTGAEHEMIIPVLLKEDIGMSEIDKAGILNRSFLQWPSKKCQGHADKIELFWNKLLTKLTSGGNIRK